jgi:hypothetical protein
MGQKAEQVGRAIGPTSPKAGENSFWNKNKKFEFFKALEICTRRIRRNFDVGFLLNSSRILKDFRKIKYVMLCNASYAYYSWEDFYMHGKFDMQPICTSMLVKFYSCKKQVLQMYPP